MAQTDLNQRGGEFREQVAMEVVEQIRPKHVSPPTGRFLLEMQGSGEQLRAGRRELHIDAALVQQQPPPCDRLIEACLVFGRTRQADR